MRHLCIFLILLSASAFGQLTNDCFLEAAMKSEEDIPSAEVKVGDSADCITKRIEKSWQSVIGCRIPFAPFRTVDGREMNYDKIDADYIIMNFNYVYCSWCTDQLDTLVQRKAESNKKVAIISFFSHDQQEIQGLINKYGKDVLFVADADNYTRYYNIMGVKPLNYVLDKNKIIVYSHRNVPGDKLLK